jgi:hypothetical protein
MQSHPCLAKESQPNPGIYTRKTQNKNLMKESYITIGDKYSDPHRRTKVSTRFTGKQLTTIPPKDTSGNIGHFNKFTYSADNYNDKTGFLKTQPIDKRKLGFGSHDAARRGEFTTAIRTEQYRQQLKSELQSNLPRGDAANAPPVEMEEMDKTFPNGLSETKHLFDIGRNQNTEFDPRSSRDTFYNALMCKSRVRSDKRTGGYHLSSQDCGTGVDDVGDNKPAFGHVRNTKTFFDRSHLGQSSLS